MIESETRSSFELECSPKHYGYMTGISHVKTLTPDELLVEFVRRSRPVIITELGKYWPAIGKWSPSYLSDRFGDVLVHVRGSRFGMKDIGDIPLSEYVDWLLNARMAGASNGSNSLLAQYHAAHPVKPYVAYDGALPQTELALDTGFSSLFPPGYHPRTTRCWIGPEGASTPLHCDSWGFNIFYQVAGAKRFTLFSPDQTRFLYTSNIFEFNTLYSRVNILAPDYTRFPRFKDARSVEITLNPGEILVLPRCWWHDVEALETSISVNCWIVRDRDKLTASYLLNSLKKAIHNMGLYANDRCTCHLSPDKQDLGRTLGWY